MNEATSLVVMMETLDALENVEEIVAVEGVDMLLVGSNDLCNEMGITGQYRPPETACRIRADDRGGAGAWQACRRRRVGIPR